jgi:hypothetical protein
MGIPNTRCSADLHNKVAVSSITCRIVTPRHDDRPLPAHALCTLHFAQTWTAIQTVRTTCHLQSANAHNRWAYLQIITSNRYRLHHRHPSDSSAACPYIHVCSAHGRSQQHTHVMYVTYTNPAHLSRDSQACKLLPAASSADDRLS